MKTKFVFNLVQTTRELTWTSQQLEYVYKYQTIPSVARYPSQEHGTYENSGIRNEDTLLNCCSSIKTMNLHKRSTLALARRTVCKSTAAILLKGLSLFTPLRAVFPERAIHRQCNLSITDTLGTVKQFALQRYPLFRGYFIYIVIYLDHKSMQSIIWRFLHAISYRGVCSGVPATVHVY